MTAPAQNTRKVNPMPSPSDPVIDRKRRFTPRWYSLFKPLIDKLNDNTTVLKAVSEDLTTATAAITTEQTVRATADSSLASQISTVSAAYQVADTNLGTQIATVSAAVTTEATARASADGALATRIDTVEASYQSADSTLDGKITTNTASITTEATARASADTALASQINTVSTTVDGHTASISTQATSIAGIEAKYAIVVNVSGNVVGTVKLDGSATGSTFTVEANTFLVAQPGVSGGSARQIFGIGNVNGSPLLGLRGDAIIDGSLTARMISVNDLSALSADLGTVTAGRIQSADGRSYWDLDTGEFSIGTA